MRKKISYRICSSLMAMVFFALAGYAQNGNTDTTVIDGTDIKIEKTEQVLQDKDQYSDDETITDYPDSLRPNFRSIVFDSVEAIKADKGFYYKRYLDSLLRASKPKEDTVVKKGKARRGVDLEGKGFFNSVFGIIFLILAIGLVGYLIYQLFLSDSALFARNKKNRSSDIKIATEETSNDPNTLLHNAIRAGNYRLAVRYLYLEVLDKLSEKRFIQINSNKTNYQYVNEVRGQKFANEFASLTLQYDYVWYGEYPLDEKLFEQIQNSFTHFNKNLTR